MMLQDFFEREYSRFQHRGFFASLYRFIIRFGANLILPIYFKLGSKRNKGVKYPGLIVSITTFPDRIGKIWLVIESILRQDVKASKICLWLSKDQFPLGFSSLPTRLKRYIEEGVLEVFFVEGDLRSHKKYFYALQKFSDELIVTVDDDIFYPSYILNKLVNLHLRYPNAICSLRGYEVTHDSEGGLNRYKDWLIVKGDYGPSNKYFHTSGGGTLYKRRFFTPDVFDSKVFLRYSLFADDVWLNIMAQIAGTQTVKSEYYSNLLPILGIGDYKLSSANVCEGGNDKQLEDLIDYYNLTRKDLFQ